MTKDDISGLIPEIYYDVIARIAAGISVLVFIISPTWEHIEKSASFTSFIALLGLGYIVGHLLTTVSFLFNCILWNHIFVGILGRFVRLNYDFHTKSMGRIFDKVYTRIDWVSMKDKSGGAILKKMEAGAALTDSLFSGWIIILIYSWLTGQVGWGVGFRNNPSCMLIILVTVLLFVSVPIRRAIFIIRQDRILYLLKYDPESAEGVQ